MEARKVQKVGYSTLTVSLPKEWVQEVMLEVGEMILIKREDDGSLKLIPGTERRREEVKNCKVNADLCNSPNLLTRTITANQGSPICTCSSTKPGITKFSCKSMIRPAAGIVAPYGNNFLS